MKKMIESITGGYVSSAKVVDGALILSLPDAISPVVWRMDLGSVKSSALEVRDQKDGTYMLTLKNPRDDVHNIAPFAEKAIAVRALMAVSHALEHGHGHSHANAARSSLLSNDILPPPPRAPAYQPTDSGMAKWATGIIAVLVLFVLIGVLVHQTPQTGSFTNQSASYSNAAAPASSTQIEPSTAATGVAVSADDFLRENSKH
jgi:hypothetical protein